MKTQTNSVLVRLRRKKAAVLILAMFTLMVPFQNCSNSFTPLQVADLQSTSGGVVPVGPGPHVEILAPLSGGFVSNQLDLVGSCETDMDVYVEIQRAALDNVVSCINGRFNATFALTIPDGTYNVLVRQTDVSGNSASANFEFVKDTIAPNLNIVSPAANIDVTTPVLIVNGICESGQPVSITGTGILAPLSAQCVNGAYSASATVGGANRSDQVTVRQTDSAGNASTLSRTFRISLPVGGPVIKISSPASATVVNKLVLSLGGTCVSGLTVTIAGSGVAQSTQVACSNSSFTRDVTLSSGDGTKTITVSQTDAQGQIGQDARSFVLDTTAPNLAILSPAAGTKNASGVTVEGSCETGLPVSVTGQITSNASVSCANSMFRAAVVFSTGAGVKTVTVQQADAVGNSRSVSRNFELIAPVVLNGAQLYATHCASCHNPLATSTKSGRSASDIGLAIQGIPQMRGISLSQAEISEIAKALGSPTSPTPTPTPRPTATPVPTPPPSGSTAALYENKALGASAARRLTREEIRQSLKLAIGVDPGTALINQLPDDPMTLDISPFDNVYERQASAPGLITALNSFADDYAKAVVAQSNHVNSKAGCTPTKVDDTACLARYIDKVGRLLLRRPLTTAEITNLSGVVTPFAVEEKTFNAAVSMVIAIMVQNPEFLFRLENSASLSTQSIVSLNDYEVASRMSFFIWGTGPDEALMSAAAAGNLRTPTGRVTQAERMFKDTKAVLQWRRFHAQWLNYVDTSLPPALSADMINETNALVDEVVFGTGHDWFDLFKLNQTFVTPALASHYSLSSPSGGAAGWVSYPSGRGGGILSHAAFLQQGAKFGDTSPTLRGYEILKRLSCGKTGTIPVGVDTSLPPSNGTAKCKTDRYYMRTATACMGCHTKTDNIGFGLENLSPFGQWRTVEPTQPSCTILGEGSLANVKFSGPVGLGNALASSDEVRSCAVKQIFRFVTGRPEVSGDSATLSALDVQLQKTPSLKSVIFEIVSSPAITYRAK